MNIIINSTFLIVLLFVSQGLALSCYGPSTDGELSAIECITGNQQHCLKTVSLAFGKINTRYHLNIIIEHFKKPMVGLTILKGIASS